MRLSATTTPAIAAALLALVLAAALDVADAFAPQRTAAADVSFRVGGMSSPTATTRLYSEAALPPKESSLTSSDDDEEEDDDDDEDEWEYVEFETLTESDFVGSEWKVGTVQNDRPTKIVETWVRLLVEEGTPGTGIGSGDRNIAIWGDGSKGRWSLDVPSQFFSISKESFGGWLGKRIWAGVIEDYYYLQGTVRGWSPISPASVQGQWQAKRLGVDKEEAGIAPWFENDDDVDENEEEG
eukprot:CAMPEP_0183302708 /NCGR_PEP_ID=MMETSP0160_2-20130417/8397_1 /TAXON_ID=2839 ORGANISM="Odontella Sinensis, Strain Grunow 1884" /NCGR_SAMPLE_ID=MMETSP0160_2 /ASSEMBLY_ACC=CAM_ASM_000250 /LENGTH=239 /DNA_ID=CAMNT_0025465511 /DNA_START=59 /DNA_END=778 /DNA_ORIENTATION=-